MIPINLSGLIANGSSPKYDPAYSAGNRAVPTLLYSENYSGSLPSGVLATGTSTATIVNGELKMTYPANADINGLPFHGVDLSTLNVSDVYIQFKARMPNAKWGLKFLKIFGKVTTTNTSNDTYSNTTWQLIYGTGAFEAVQFGDGSALANDNASAIGFAGGTQSGLTARNSGAIVSCPQSKAFLVSDWGTSIHQFKIRTKFNTGTSALNEVADGAYYLEIDGNVYLNATGLFNRSWQSGNIDRIEIGGYTTGSNPSFDIEYDDLIISTGGFF